MKLKIMKELIGNASNVYYVTKDGENFTPQVEIILIVSEPQFRIGGGGQFIRERITETFRFTTSCEQLKNLSVNFAELADEMDLQGKDNL